MELRLKHESYPGSVLVVDSIFALLVRVPSDDSDAIFGLPFDCILSKKTCLQPICCVKVAPFMLTFIFLW